MTRWTRENVLLGIATRLRGWLAALLRASGNFEAAAQEYQRVLENRPDDPSALSELAALYHAVGQFGSAASLLKRLAMLAPESSSKWTQLAEVLTKQKRWNESQEASSRAVKLNPLDWKARRLLLQSAVACGNKREAEAQRTLFARAGMPLD